MITTRTELLCQSYDKAEIDWSELVTKIKEILYPNGELHV